MFERNELWIFVVSFAVPLFLILRSRDSGVSKDEANVRASWFETARECASSP